MLDFGQVCLRSITTKNLNIVNNLDRHVLVIAEVSFLQITIANIDKNIYK